MIVQFYAKSLEPGAIPVSLVSYSTDHVISVLAQKLILPQLTTFLPLTSRGERTILVESRRDFAILSMKSRWMKCGYIPSITIQLSDADVDEKAEFLAEILQTFRRNDNTIDELHLEYGHTPPSPSSARTLFQAVADLRFVTVTLRDGAKVDKGLYPSYGRKSYFSCTICPGDTAVDHLMAAISQRLTHLTMIAHSTMMPWADALGELETLPESQVAASASRGGHTSWMQIIYPRLRDLSMVGSFTKLSNLLDFLCEHNELASLSIHPLSDFQPPEFCSATITHREYCPPNLLMQDACALNFLKAFRNKPDVEHLQLIPSHRTPPQTEDLDCLRFVKSAKKLSLSTQISSDGLFYHFSCSGAKHRGIETLNFWNPSRDIGPGPRPKICAQAVEVSYQSSQSL